jgi:hypothetical protein
MKRKYKNIDHGLADSDDEQEPSSLPRPPPPPARQSPSAQAAEGADNDKDFIGFEDSSDDLFKSILQPPVSLVQPPTSPKLLTSSTIPQSVTVVSDINNAIQISGYSAPTGSETRAPVGIYDELMSRTAEEEREKIKTAENEARFERLKELALEARAKKKDGKKENPGDGDGEGGGTKGVVV